MRTRRKALIVAGIVLAGVSAYGIFGPDVITPPDRWDPPEAPALEGVLAPNGRLARANLVAKGKLVGPESVAAGKDGRIYSGISDGRVVRVDVAKDTVDTFSRTGTASEGCGKKAELETTCGRVLGARFAPSGDLIVADSGRGRLLSIDPQGRVTVLSAGLGGKPFNFIDDLDIGTDGAIYFSEASTRWARKDYRYEVLENSPYGKLLKYSPDKKAVEVLLDRLYFANGVTLTHGEDAVLVVETSRYRVQRYWLKGPLANTAQVFAENLPGIPDNIRRGSENTYWVALGAKRNPLIDALHPHPFGKRVLARLVPLETFTRYFVPKVGLVVRLDRDGKVIESLWDENGSFVPQISEANEYDGKLYIGSIEADRIGVLDLAQPTAR